MKTKTINLYSVNELSEEARERAFSDFCQESDYFWHYENKDSLNAFERIFPVKVTDWEYGYRTYINFSFTENEDIKNLSGQRLATYLWNNYKNNIYSKKYYSTSGHYDENKKHHYKSRHSKIFIEEYDCPLTGYYMDNSLLSHIWDFIRKLDDRTFYDLMKDCLNEWIHDCQKDFEYYFSMENFIEMSKGNEWTYRESGKLEL